MPTLMGSRRPDVTAIAPIPPDESCFDESRQSARPAFRMSASRPATTPERRKRPARQVSKERRMLTAEVVRAEQLSPSMRRITVAGPNLAQYDYLGADQIFRFFFKRPGQQQLRMPTWSNDGWLGQLMLMSSATRPQVRMYTARAFRRESMELDIEFVIHGDTAPASGWAVRAQPGEPVGFFDEGVTYLPPQTGWQLLVGDESAMPALLSILENAPAELRAEVFLEVPLAEDVRDLSVPDGVHLHWLPREDEHAVPGRLALETLIHTELPPTNPSYSFLAGESGLATGARRFLVNERSVPKQDITFQGYWKHGKSSPG